MDAVTYYRRASDRTRHGDLPGAIADYQQVLQLDPHFAEAFYNQGFLYCRLGQTRSGLENLHRAVQEFEAQGKLEAAQTVRNLIWRLRIELRPFSEADFPALIQWIDSPKTHRIWGGSQILSYPLDETQLKKYAFDTQRGSVQRIPYAIIWTETQTPIGHVDWILMRQQDSATIARVFIDPQYRRRGISRQVLQELLNLGFRRYHLQRVELTVYEFNTGAIACYEQVGFVQEGVLRRYAKFESEYWNVVLMSILKEEWLQRVAAQS